MFKIDCLKINDSTTTIVTDSAPNIGFSLVADKEDTEFDYAVMRVDNWKLITKDQINNIYTGPLKPHTEYTLKVTAYSKNADTANADVVFKTGRLKTPWQGKWITDLSYNFPKKISPIPMTFFKKFQLKEKKVLHAWIEATALGVYELNLNGEKVGEDYFAPGFTSYLNQIQYQTYDLTNLISEENSITTMQLVGENYGQ